MPAEIWEIVFITWHSSRYLGCVSPYIICSEYELFSVAKIIQIHFKIIIYLSAWNAFSLFSARHYINCNFKCSLTSNGITPRLISLSQQSAAARNISLIVSCFISQNYHVKDSSLHDVLWNSIRIFKNIMTWA